jgi:hypothetical protein
MLNKRVAGHEAKARNTTCHIERPRAVQLQACRPLVSGLEPWILAAPDNVHWLALLDYM